MNSLTIITDLHRSHHLDSSTNLFIPLKPPQEFRTIFFNPVLLDLFVKVSQSTCTLYGQCTYVHIVYSYICIQYDVMYHITTQ